MSSYVAKTQFATKFTNIHYIWILCVEKHLNIELISITYHNIIVILSVFDKIIVTCQLIEKIET